MNLLVRISLPQPEKVLIASQAATSGMDPSSGSGMSHGEPKVRFRPLPGTLAPAARFPEMKRTVALCAMLAMVAACDAREEEQTAVEPQPVEEPPAVARGTGNSSNAAVASPKGPSQPADPAAKPRLALDPDGLRWFLPPGGSARPLAFGMPQADVLASLEPVRGEAAVGTNADCGAGPVEYATWKDGLSLVFKDGRFVGWGIDGRARGAIATADGIGIGTTRAELDDAIGPPLTVRQSTLGTEFTAGAYHGLFSGRDAAAAITDMWAGVSCVAR